MSLTIELAPDAEARLREKAAREGQDLAVVAAAVLADALEWEARENAEAARGIRQGLEDFVAGRSRPFADFAAEQRIRYGPGAGE